MAKLPKSDGEGLYRVPFEYEALLGSDDRDLGFYTRLARRHSGPVLDLATGAGRVALALAAEGLETWGLDREQAMLALAAQRSQGLGCPPQWVLGDLRRFDLGRRFPLILLPYNGLQHLHSAEDLSAFFRCLNAHAEPHTCFALDLHLPQAALLARDPDEWYGVDSQPGVTAERSAYDPLSQVLTQTWAYTDGQGQPAQASLALRQFFPQELKALLLAQGWRISQAFGGFEGEPLGPHSLKQVLLTERL